jgi:microcystin-dependent protein
MMRRTSISRVAALTVALSGLLGVHSAQAQASDPYIGQLMMTAANFCPRGWMQANGALLQISQYTALFSLLGTMYGGNGIQTFQLPNLSGRTPIGDGQLMGGMSNYVQGQEGGQESVTITQSQMPMHVHTQNVTATTAIATDSAPGGGRVLAQAQNAGIYATSNGSTTSVASGITGVSGGSQPLDVRNPYLAMRWCIATEGVFPPRN